MDCYTVYTGVITVLCTVTVLLECWCFDCSVVVVTVPFLFRLFFCFLLNFKKSVPAFKKIQVCNAFKGLGNLEVLA